MKEKIIEVTVEREHIQRSSRRIRAVEVWCGECNQTVMMLRPDEAAILSGLSVRSLCRAVEASELHFAETPDGLLFICLNSLIQISS